MYDITLVQLGITHLKPVREAKAKTDMRYFLLFYHSFAKECVVLSGSLIPWPEITAGILSISGNALSGWLIISTDTDTKWIGYWRDVTDPR